MNKEFLFMEEGSIEYPHLKKFLDKSGFTDANIIQYKKGTPKPELISVEVSESTQNPEVYKQEAKKEFLRALAEYLDKTVGRRGEKYFDETSYREVIRFAFVVDGTVEEFVDKFAKFLEIYKEYN